MSSPIRVQRKRVKGYKMPENTVSVTRPGKWGNPFKVNMPVPEEWVSKLNHDDHFHFMKFECGYVDGAENAVWLFRHYVAPTLDLTELRGKNLACFCKIGDACHADVLLELANKD